MAKQEKADPNDFYDSLSQEAKDQWDAIGIFGYTPEKGTAGLWFARKPGQNAKDAIGPADSLQSLHAQVKSEVEASAKWKASQEQSGVVDLDGFKSSRLPGMDEPAIEELDRQAEVVRQAKIALDAAKAKHADEADLMKELLHKHGRKRCRYGGWNHVIEETEKLVSKPETKEKKGKNDGEMSKAA